MTGWQDWGERDAAAWIAVPTDGSDKYSRGVLGMVTGSGRWPAEAVLGVEGASRTGVGMIRYLGADRPADLQQPVQHAAHDKSYIESDVAAVQPTRGGRADVQAGIHERDRGGEADHHGHQGIPPVAELADVEQVSEVQASAMPHPVHDLHGCERGNPIGDEQQHVLELGRQVTRIQIQGQEERQNGDDHGDIRPLDPSAGRLQGE